MENRRRQGRWGQLIVTLAIVAGLAVSQPFLASADDEKTGEAAIEAALGGLNGESTTEEAPPPAEGTTEEAPPPEEAPPAESEAPAESETAPAEGEAAPADSGQTSGEAAPATDETASSGGASNETSGGSDESGAASDDQASDSSGGESQRGNNATTPESQGLAEGAISSVLFGGGATDNQPAIAGGVDEQSAQQSAQQATDVRTVGDDLRAAAPTNNNRGDGSNREENGTVVVNNLEDSGDQGKLAVHGHIVAGTLCDGSQFWSLDGGGTVNANGVTLSANGGTAGTDAGGGDDNAAGGEGSAGNGGSAHSSADGGIVVVDELVTGNNTGNQVSVGDQSFNGDCGQGVIDGGDATTISNVNISADGGTAFADASGGDNNLAGDGGSAGNGGRASASADGGMVILGSVFLGNNEGNTVDVNSAGGSGSGSGGSCLVDGGTSTTISNIDISADGGIALADASGGDDNVAFGEDAEAGNGGRAVANADGGLILGGDIITGNNQGNQIEGTCGGSGGGSTQVYGGDVVNQTDITLSADGGLAVADASGGDDNVALGSGNDDAAAGNGGVARSDASGGRIQVGDIVTGNNVGNVIAFGANLAPVPGGSDEPKPSRVRIDKQPTAGTSGKAARTISKKGAAAPAGRAAKAVGKLPDTGVGTGLVAGQQVGTSQVLGSLALLGVAVAGMYATRGNRLALVSSRSSERCGRRGR